MNRLRDWLGIGGYARTTAVTIWLLWFSAAAYLAPETAAAIASQGGGDSESFGHVVNAMRQGRSYYDAMGAMLRSEDFPSASVFNWRSPAIYIVFALLPFPEQWLLIPALLTIVAFALPRLPSAWPIWICVAVVSTAFVMAHPKTAWLSEPWAGIFIAISMAFVIHGRWHAALTCAVIACLIRELSVLYLAVLWIAERRRFSHWNVLLMFGALATFYSLHWRAVLEAVQPGDRLGISWLAFGGMGFVRESLHVTALGLIAVVPLAWLLGVSTVAPDMPRVMRWSIWAYALGFMIAGRPDNGYWGFIVSPSHMLAVGYLPPYVRWRTAKELIP
jgi:hypothetical protein